MEGIIVDWDRVKSGGEVDVFSTYYSFLGVVPLLIGEGTVEDLKLFDGEENVTSEEGFREFLKIILSFPWKEEELDENQLSALNKMAEYLGEDYTQEPQPINSGGTTIEQLAQQIEQGVQEGEG